MDLEYYHERRVQSWLRGPIKRSYKADIQVHCYGDPVEIHWGITYILPPYHFTMHFSIRVALPVLGASIAHAAIAPKPIPPPSTAAFSATSGQSTFQQLIDHKNPSLGTFSQRYWWNSAWWNGAGAPVTAPVCIVKLLSMLI